jgi:carbamoyl-phosphate synthase large subunit
MENFKLRGKDKLDEIAKLIGLPSPEMQVVNTVEDLNKAVEEIGFPVMIKGAFYGADKAINMQDAQKHYHSVVAQWGYPVIVQKETAGEEINLVGVGNGEGSLLGHVAVKKMSRTKQGKIWTGVSIHNDELKNAAKTFVSKYKWNGPFEMECIIHNNEMYLLEINPRFPAWVYFAAGVGVNLPSRLIRDVYGLDNKNESYESGKLYVRHTSEHITDMATFQKIITQGEIK